jgi:RNA polymerase sigma-70 factor (ECF subfamily)
MHQCLSQARSLDRPWFMTAPDNNRQIPGTQRSADRVWFAFVAALDTLAPDARVAFLLHEVFETSYDDIARLTGQPAEACRAHVEYAREHALHLMKRLIEHKKATPK